MRAVSRLIFATTLGALLTTSLALLGPAQAQNWETSTLGGMSTHVYTPASGGVVGTGRGLLVVLHGCTQGNDPLKTYGNFETAAEDYGLVVAIPLVPGGGVYAGCWDYYGAVQTRDTKHNDNVLDLVTALLADSGKQIDPNQVYIVGFSSGGGQALVLGCLAPDVFAGIGVAAGPAIGTSVTEFGSVNTTAQAETDLCASFAGSHTGDFDTQILSVLTGTSDFTVAQGYAPLNADAFETLYGGSFTESSLDVSALDGVNPSGTGSLFSDGSGPRISLISATGHGHAWPAGSGDSGGESSFVAGQNLAYASYLGQFFNTNNRRVAPKPQVTNLSGTADQDARSITVTGTATSPSAGIASVTVSLTGAQPQGPFAISPVASGDFEHVFSDLPTDTWYTPTVYATDTNGVSSDVVTADPIAIGNAPASPPPTIQIDVAVVNGDCATIPGTITDDGEVTQAELELDGAVHTLTLEPDGSFAYEQCGLSEGCYSPVVRATDEMGQESTASGPEFEVGTLGQCLSNGPLRQGCACTVGAPAAPRWGLLWALVLGALCWIVHRNKIVDTGVCPF